MLRLFLILFFSVIFSLNAQKTEKIIFKSANPFALSDIISDLESQKKQEVFGKLTFPVDSLDQDKKYPLIIGVAGSLGWRKHHHEYMQMYQKSGFDTFELNSFKSRNIKSTVGKQNQVTVAAMVFDAYKALEKLSQHPSIDKDKISITGWSLGGGVTLFSAWKPIIKALGQSVNFASHLAFYPPCFFDFEEMSFSDSPIHILIGELDDWTPAKPCDEFVKKLAKSNVNITIYENPTDEFKIEIFGKTNIYLALNTKSESFGITLLEAVNNGNLVISSDLSSFINVLPNSHIVYKNNNFDSLCNVLTKLDSEDLNSLWNKQYKDIREYDLKENMKKFILLYSNL